jgi:hypothetical protein
MAPEGRTMLFHGLREEQFFFMALEGRTSQEEGLAPADGGVS